MKKLLNLAAGVAAAAISATVFAAPVPFSGSWSPGSSTGTIGPGTLTWTANATTNNGIPTNSWSVPGVGQGLSHWMGADGYRDFHIAFDLPAGVALDTRVGTNCAGGATGGTVLCEPFPDLRGLGVWDVVFDGPNSVSFYAPSGQSLDSGELFFVNILFTGPATSGRFQGSWTDTGRVPEPATVMLLGAGLAALGLSRRRSVARA